MRWCYKTVHFELKKDGLLGSAFLDDAEIEETLNEFGSAGWELVSMVDTRDGVLAVFKQPMAGMQRTPVAEEIADGDREEALHIAPAIPPVGKEEYEEMVAVEGEEITEQSPAFDMEADPEPGGWPEEPLAEEYEDLDLDLDESEKAYKSGDSDEDEEDEDQGLGSIRIE